MKRLTVSQSVDDAAGGWVKAASDRTVYCRPSELFRYSFKEIALFLATDAVQSFKNVVTQKYSDNVN